MIAEGPGAGQPHPQSYVTTFHFPGRRVNEIRGLRPAQGPIGPKSASLLLNLGYVLGTGRSVDVQGLPIVKPPWGRITAIDLNRGELVWQIAHGETLDEVKNHPALAGLTIPRTGSGRILGTLVTRTLVIAGEGEVTTTGTGERGAMLRAYDKATGEEVGAVYLPAPQTGSPMTYQIDGRQYVVLAVSGAGFPAEFLAFRAPLMPDPGARVGKSASVSPPLEGRGCQGWLLRIIPGDPATQFSAGRTAVAIGS